jgi:hypothetical protein
MAVRISAGVGLCHVGRQLWFLFSLVWIIVLIATMIYVAFG